MSSTRQYVKGGKQKNYYGQDEVVVRNCPLCGGTDYSAIHKERGSIGIAKCKCGLIYTNPMVKDAEKNYWGNEEAYYEESRLIFENKAGHHRDPNYLEDLKRIEDIKPEGNFLDIGTNMGFFLRHTRGKKWKVFGVEPSPALSGMARKYFGLNVINSYLDEAGFPEDFFDIVTMTDVFEHIAEPDKMLKDIKRVLKQDGILFIKVPNANYSLLKFWLSKLTGKTRDFDIFDSYEHLTHFTYNSLNNMLNIYGFKIKKVFNSKPIQPPTWHKHVGHYYQYPSPLILDAKVAFIRILFYWISKAEFLLRFGRPGYFAPHITIIAQHENRVTGIGELISNIREKSFNKMLEIVLIPVAYLLKFLIKRNRKKQALSLKTKQPRIIITGSSKSGTTILFYSIKKSLTYANNFRYLFEQRKFIPINDAYGSKQGVLAKILIDSDQDCESYKNFDKKILIVRDPRDNFISKLLFNSVDYRNYRKNPKEFKKAMDYLKKKEKEPSSLSLIELWQFFYKANTTELTRWTKKLLSSNIKFWEEHQDYFVFKYEDLIKGNTSTLESYLGMTLNVDDGNKELQKEHSGIARSKSFDNWRNWFTNEDVSFFKPTCQQFMKVFRYDFDDWTLNKEQIILSKFASEYFDKHVNIETIKKPRAIKKINKWIQKL